MTTYLLIACFFAEIWYFRPQMPKLMPTHVGVDPAVKGYVDEFIDLGKKKGIHFHGTVNVGFRPLHEYGAGNVIGLCSYSVPSREVEFDPNFWDFASDLTRRMLVFHELTHCFCERGHDFGKDRSYENSFIDELLERIFHIHPYPETRGYFGDNCPLSIMFPEIISEECATAHYQHYLNEMFERCSPY